MNGLPWSLDFRVTTAGFGLEQSFDAATGRFDAVLVSTASRARSIQALTLEAALDLPAPSGYARLNSTLSGANDMIREFGAAAEPHGRAPLRLQSEGWIALTCPARAFPTLVAGALDANLATTFTLELDTAESVLRTLAIAVDLGGRRVAPGDSVRLALYLAEGHGADALTASYVEAVVDGRLASDLPSGALNGVVPVSGVAGAASASRTGFLPAVLVTPGDDEPAAFAARVHDAVDGSGAPAAFLDRLPPDPGRFHAILSALRAALGASVPLFARDVPMALAAGAADVVVAAPTRGASGPEEVAAAVHTALLRGVIHERWWNAAFEFPAPAAALPEAAWRTALTGAALSGFVPILPLDVDRLPVERRIGIESVLPATGIPADPLTPIPLDGLSAWRATLSSGRILVGVFNWNDRPRWIAADDYLRPGEVAFDFWGARLAGMGDVLIAPWDAALWQVAPQGRGARLVGDAANLTSASLYQRPVSGRLQLGNDLDRPRVVAVHARGETFTATLQPGERRWFD